MLRSKQQTKGSENRVYDPRLNIYDPAEVKHWASELGISPAQLRHAAGEVGTGLHAISSHLQRGKPSRS